MEIKDARVFQIEDYIAHREVVEMEAERSGFTLVGVALTYNTGLEAIRSTDHQDVNVWIIDSNLSKGAQGGTEGINLLANIRELRPAAKVISFSTTPLAEADASINKTHYDLSDNEIAAAIAKL